MGTHPIFESDFDCLTDLKSVLSKMALVPVEDDSATSSSACCRLFYETQINGLTLRRMIFKNTKRLCSQSGRLENRAYLDPSGSFLLTKEIKPGQTIQTDKIEL